MNRRSVLGGAGVLAGMMIPMQAGGREQPSTGTPNFVALERYGAKGDGQADDTDALQRALDDTFNQKHGTFLVIPPGRYRITRTLRVSPSVNVTRPTGILAHGARLVSSIENGGNVVEIVSQSTFRFLLIQGLEIAGSGKDGIGLSLECETPGKYLYNFCLRDLVVQNCGGDGVRLAGNVFEGQLSNCYFRNNRGNGVTFAHGARAGILSAVRVIGSVFGENAVHGAAMVNGCYDVSYHGCYFLLNGKFGLLAENGCTLLSSCGFENNHQAAPDFASGSPGLRLRNFGTLIGCTAYSRFKQTALIDAFVAGRLVMIGCTGSGGGRASAAYLARLRGATDAQAVTMGCSGDIRCEGGFEALDIGSSNGGGIRLSDRWDSRNQVQLGNYHLWVDSHGELRMKKGRPEADTDGRPVGRQA